METTATEKNQLLAANRKQLTFSFIMFNKIKIAWTGFFTTSPKKGKKSKSSSRLASFVEIVSPPPSRVFCGIWSDEGTFVKAVKELKSKGYKNFSAITPFPVHGLEEKMDIKRSWIPWVTFLFGLTGCSFGLWFTWFTSAVSWPLNIGGKPMWSLPAFIPVIFELTILFAALSTVGALLYACGLPRLLPPILDKGLSSNKFAIYFPLATKKKSIDELKTTLKLLGAGKTFEGDF